MSSHILLIDFACPNSDSDISNCYSYASICYFSRFKQEAEPLKILIWDHGSTTEKVYSFDNFLVKFVISLISYCEPVDLNLLLIYLLIPCCLRLTYAVQLQYFILFLDFSLETTNQENQNNSTICSDGEMLDVLDVKDIHDGMWVKVRSQGEYFRQRFICGKHSDKRLMF